jgi:hypothetical protein
MVTEAGLAASAVILCGWAKIIVRMKAAQRAAAVAFKALFDLGALDFLMSNVSFWRRVGLPAGSRRTTVPVLLIIQYRTMKSNGARLANSWLSLGAVRSPEKFEKKSAPDTSRGVGR